MKEVDAIDKTRGLLKDVMIYSADQYIVNRCRIIFKELSYESLEVVLNSVNSARMAMNNRLIGHERIAVFLSFVKQHAGEIIRCKKKKKIYKTMHDLEKTYRDNLNLFESIVRDMEDANIDAVIKHKTKIENSLNNIVFCLKLLKGINNHEVCKETNCR